MTSPAFQVLEDLAVFFAAASLSSSIAEARGPYGSIVVGNWKGGPYTDDATGKFTSCIAGAGYRSGIHFMVSISAQRAWSVRFAHPNWKLQRGQSFPIVLTFDGQGPFNINGVPLSNEHLSARVKCLNRLLFGKLAARGIDLVGDADFPVLTCINVVTSADH